MAGVKGRSGGRRSGSGRKPKYTTNEYQRNKLLKKAQKWAKDQGRDEDDVLLSIIHGKQDEGYDFNYRDRLAAYEIFKKYTKEPEKSELEITHNKAMGPVIGLPPAQEDPAKLIPIDGGKEATGENK